MDDEIVLKATDIHKSFSYPLELTILKGLNLIVRRGETVAIMGRSGQGKSTLLQILGTLEKPCSGQLEIAGQLVTPLSCSKIRNQNIAFIFQSFHLLDDCTTLENVLMPASIARRSTSPGSKTHQHAMELLDRVGLTKRAHFNTKLLSGGEKQRVAIVRALCNDPDIIFADEPSGNLDQQTAEGIHKILLDFAREKNKTLIAVTHDQDLADLCSKNYRLESGTLTRDCALIRSQSL